MCNLGPPTVSECNKKNKKQIPGLQQFVRPDVDASYARYVINTSCAVNLYLEVNIVSQVGKTTKTNDNKGQSKLVSKRWHWE